MATKKKTLYEILAIAPDALDIEIRAAYETRNAKLESMRNQLDAEDFTFKAKVLSLAFQTLSSPGSRDAYDAKLAASALREPAMSLVPRNAGSDSLSLQADSMALRAEALTLRADALAMRSGAMPAGDRRIPPLAAVARPYGMEHLFRNVLLILGTVFALIVVSQLIASMVTRHRAVVEAESGAKAEEKAQLQEYYQAHGVRPANLAELRLMQAEDRRKEEEIRTAERQKTQQELAIRRFEQESRRRGDLAAAELHRVEAQSADRQRRMDEDKANREKQEQRVTEMNERMRLDRLKAEWNQELRRRW